MRRARALLAVIAVAGCAGPASGTSSQTARPAPNGQPSESGHASPGGSSSQSGSSGPASSPSPGLVWVIPGSSLDRIRLAANSDAVSARFFDNAQTYIVDQAKASHVPDGWSSREAVTFTSIAALQAGLAGHLDPDVRAVVYDYEAWSQTPPEEQRYPQTYLPMAAQAAHARGLVLIATPGTDLVTVEGLGAYQSRADAYLADRIGAQAADYADVVEIQAQSTGANPTAYAAFVTSAASQIRAERPGIKVLAGLTTGPEGHVVDPHDLVLDVQATRSVVDGYWLNVRSDPATDCSGCPGSNPLIALHFLQMLAGSG